MMATDVATTLTHTMIDGHAPTQQQSCSRPSGVPENFGVNPMDRDLSKRVSRMNDTPRCGARTRGGRPCRCPAMRNGKCRIHGGLSPGAPRGPANGNYRNGYWTREAAEERKFIRLLVKGILGYKP